jgi:hypothetical protein
MSKYDNEQKLNQASHNFNNKKFNLRYEPQEDPQHVEIERAQLAVIIIAAMEGNK